MNLMRLQICFRLSIEFTKLILDFKAHSNMVRIYEIKKTLSTSYADSLFSVSDDNRCIENEEEFSFSGISLQESEFGKSP